MIKKKTFGNKIEVKVKKLTSTAKLPTRAHKTDAGMDLYADSTETDENGNLVIGTGIAVEIPKGYVGLIYPRSSIANRRLLQTNSVGVIDSSYRGEVKVKFRHALMVIVNFKYMLHALLKRLCPKLAKRVNLDKSINEFYISHRNDYKVGERIAQLIIMPYPQVRLTEVEELSESERGEGGFGSTGR
jgi:dUTP pyrophosphatase